ncbi:fluoride efflux transporter FluC, partial [Leuconostoc inhae]|uniref:fluoride efflux transporter FluC n=1 Tax=Leuconostoc inhae TaxID=178001 RepID=UPI001FE85CEB
MKYLKDSTLLTSCLVVFFGGSLGSLFRLLITEIPHIGSSPWVIVVINVLGSFFLAYIGAVIPDSYDYSLILKNFIGTGIMGCSYTENPDYFISRVESEIIKYRSFY